MVKYLIISVLFIGLTINVQAQTIDTFRNEKKIEYYEKLFSEYLVVMWERMPVLTNCSWKQKFVIEEQLKKLGYNEFIILSIIIDKTGIPIYIKVDTKMKPEDKQYLIKEVEKLRFNPAIQNGKPVESFSPMHFPQFKDTNKKRDKKRIKRIFKPC